MPVSVQNYLHEIIKSGLASRLILFVSRARGLQQLAHSSGVMAGSPKGAFFYALQNGLIAAKDEKIWLEMLEDRNLTSHTYKKSWPISC